MARLATLAALLGLLVVLGTGCGYGTADEGKISETADTYVRSLADGDETTACDQLTADARAGLDGGCGRALRQVAARVGAERLEKAADRGFQIEVDGGTGSAVARELHTRLTLVLVGGEWRIDGGYRLDSN